jgi:hypothetical protein
VPRRGEKPRSPITGVGDRPRFAAGKKEREGNETSEEPVFS